VSPESSRTRRSFQGAIADGDVYDAQLITLANQDVGPKDAFLRGW
jgi:hypothetical protein